MLKCATLKEDGSPCSNPVCPEDKRSVGTECAQHYVRRLRAALEQLAKARCDFDEAEGAQWDILVEAIDSLLEEHGETEPVEDSKREKPNSLLGALQSVWDAQRELFRLGWNGSPFPRDRHILVVEAGSLGVFTGYFTDNGLFVEDGGDLWPCNAPLAWREVGT